MDSIDNYIWFTSVSLVPNSIWVADESFILGVCMYALSIDPMPNVNNVNTL